MGTDIFVYCLIDPRDQTIFYAGKTFRGADEPLGYIKNAHSGSTSRYVKRYLRRLYNLGLEADWEILEETTLENLSMAETFWISSLRAAGATIMNMTDGGEGHRHTEASKKLISEKQLGIPKPKSALSNTGKKRSLATRAKISAKALDGEGRLASSSEGIRSTWWMGIPREPEQAG